MGLDILFKYYNSHIFSARSLKIIANLPGCQAISPFIGQSCFLGRRFPAGTARTGAAAPEYISVEIRCLAPAIAQCGLPVGKRRSDRARPCNVCRSALGDSIPWLPGSFFSASYCARFIPPLTCWDMVLIVRYVSITAGFLPRWPDPIHSLFSLSMSPAWICIHSSPVIWPCKIPR